MKAQVGIGTSAPDANTILDLNSTNKGLLIPRVQLTDINDMTTIPVTSSATSPEQGTIVYNLADAGVSPSNVFKDIFYIWTGMNWENIGEVSDVRAEVDNKNTTHLLFSGSPLASSVSYIASAYSTWTTMNFATERFDNGNIHGGGTFTIPATGLYSFFGDVSLSLSNNNGTSKSFGARILNVTTNTVLSTSYFGTSIGGTSGDMPLYWMGILPANTVIQIQFRMRDTLSSTISINTNSSITVRKHF
ncbi:hypothetical protein A0O34_15795 [Chryseobacterium glaciei]|uniref:C1q domain-containing protein n=2 Tax=Chryseobacterium glaciei TaxID=1685010 RepID=A0A172XY01_9FLAO|nr:hypothetical protein A0O34_15795 [Chryseobacterium glaciei]